jgi:hypothetical protein
MNPYQECPQYVANALLVQERDEALQRLELANARQEAVSVVLRRLIATHDPKAHLWPDEQQAWRDAMAAVAESEGL